MINRGSATNAQAIDDSPLDESAVDDVENVFEPRFNDRDTAIQVLGLYKRYRNYHRSKVILNGLNLNCQAGKLYILYGTGKSGKSAVVKSILHIEPFSRGAIAILNRNIRNSYNDVGYMPQKVGLDTCLTVFETITYFANLQKLQKHDCFKDFSAMQSPITMSEYSTLVLDLNHDQRKVLSFYIAIMASPKIVVLDQPVAGCDALYKHFFWLKLRSMVDDQATTVLMTCADEIDVKYADTVGYLRNGQIIVEESPTVLMKRYNIWSFNDLILSISVAELKKFEIAEIESPQTNDDVSIKSGGFTVTHFTSNNDSEPITNEKIMFHGSFSESGENRNGCQSFHSKDIMKQLWVLIKWQTLISVRNYFEVIVQLLLPTLCVLLYGFSVGNDMTGVNLGVVFCCNTTHRCDKLGDPKIYAFEKRISEKYLHKIHYDSYDEAAEGAATGEVSAVLLLDTDPNYGEHKNTKFGCESTAFQKSNIVLEVGFSPKSIRSHIIDQLSRAYGGCEDNPLIPLDDASTCLTECPITPFIPVFKSEVVVDTEAMHLIWGAVAIISHFSGAILGALPLCVQNRNGVLDRMQIIEITNCQLLIVHWATRTIFILVQNLLLLTTAMAFLDLHYSAYGFFSGWLAITLQTLCGFSFGILLFAILKKQVPIILGLIVLELIVASLSGFFWNYYGLADLFQKITIVVPHHAVSKLLYRVIIRNIGLTQQNTYIGFLSPIFWMLSAFVIYCVYNVK